MNVFFFLPCDFDSFFHQKIENVARRTVDFSTNGYYCTCNYTLDDGI